MFLYKRVSALQNYLEEVRATGETIGFVPTMGALHEGHASLIRHSIMEGHHTVVSIYVNPKQFNDSEDLKKYPRNVGRDIELLYELGCHVLFLPDDPEIYPDNATVENLELGDLGTTLEGAFRPGHFDGVVQVMTRLLEIVEPDYLLMGQKDLQQLVVIRHLIRMEEWEIILEGLPISREASGLARSSRNERLTASQREEAVVIYNTLKYTKERFSGLTLDVLQKEAIRLLKSAGMRVEYFEFVEGQNLKILAEKAEASGEIYAVTAVWCGEVRLIDNMLMNE